MFLMSLSGCRPNIMPGDYIGFVPDQQVNDRHSQHDDDRKQASPTNSLHPWKVSWDHGQDGTGRRQYTTIIPRSCPLDVPRLGGSAVNALADPDRPVDQLAKRLLVHIVQPPEVQAALPGLVRAQPRQHRLVPGLELATR